MPESSRPSIQIDLNEFKLHLRLKNKTRLTLHFNSPSRRFYLSVIALVVSEMKKSGKIKSIPLWEHLDLLSLLNESVGGAAGSSEKVNLLHRIYTKWVDALPNLEEAPLFKVLGRKKEEGDGTLGKVYSFSDVEKDGWANLFEYMGSNENLRVKFAIDKIEVGLNEASIIFGDSVNGEAWDKFVSSLKKEEKQEKEESAPVEETAVPEPAAIAAPAIQQPKISRLYRYRWVALAVVIGLAAAGIWKMFLSPARIEVASVDRMKYPLPDNPSIAVMPFLNMSGDSKQDFLCDGLTDEIITALTRVPRFFVIARNSTFTYKGKAVKVTQVSEELGVRYVLEGGFQKSGDRVRVTVQLIDALTGNHLWAERYDRELKDIFALEDEIIIKVLNGVQMRLTWGGDISKAGKYAEKYYGGKQGLECYLKLMEADGLRQHWSIEGNNSARRMVEDAIAMCPENPIGYINLGWVCHTDYLLGNTKSPRETLEKGIELAQKALAMDDSLSAAHALLSNLFCHRKEYDQGIAEGRRALALNPSGVSPLHSVAINLTSAGRPGEAIPILEKAIRLSPLGASFLYNSYGWALHGIRRFEEAISARKKALEIAPDNLLAHSGLAVTYIYAGQPEEAIPLLQKVIKLTPFPSSSLYHNLGDALRDTGRFEEAVSAFKNAIQLEPDNSYVHCCLAITYIMMGRYKETRVEAREVLRITPKFSVDSWAKTFAYKDQSQQDKTVNAARKAGLK